MDNETVTVVRDNYKGFPMLKLVKGEKDKYPFAFGVAKAKLILAHIKDIEAFVREGEAEQEAAKAAKAKDKAAAAEKKVALK